MTAKTNVILFGSRQDGRKKNGVLVRELVAKLASKPEEPVAHHPQRELIRLVIDRLYPSGRMCKLPATTCRPA